MKRMNDYLVTIVCLILSNVCVIAQDNTDLSPFPASIGRTGSPIKEEKDALPSSLGKTPAMKEEKIIAPTNFKKEAVKQIVDAAQQAKSDLNTLREFARSAPSSQEQQMKFIMETVEALAKQASSANKDRAQQAASQIRTLTVVLVGQKDYNVAYIISAWNRKDSQINISNLNTVKTLMHNCAEKKDDSNAQECSEVLNQWIGKVEAQPTSRPR